MNAAEAREILVRVGFVAVDAGLYKPEAKAKPSKPAQAKPRNSGDIKADIERAPLGLGAAKRRLAQTEKVLAAAKSDLAAAKARLKELRARGVHPTHGELKQLLGYTYWSKTYERDVPVTGKIEQLETTVAQRERDLPGLKKQVEVEHKRVAGVLKGLNAELKEALLREGSDGRLGRDRVALTRLEGGFGYDPNEDLQPRANVDAYDQRMADTGF
jgi:hypothetical protein